MTLKKTFRKKKCCSEGDCSLALLSQEERLETKRASRKHHKGLVVCRQQGTAVTGELAFVDEEPVPSCGLGQLLLDRLCGADGSKLRVHAAKAPVKSQVLQLPPKHSYEPAQLGRAP